MKRDEIFLPEFLTLSNCGVYERDVMSTLIHPDGERKFDEIVKDVERLCKK